MKRIAWLVLAAALVACSARNDTGEDSTTPVSDTVADSALTTATAVCGATGHATITRRGIGDLKLGAPVDSIRVGCGLLTDSIRPGIEGLPERVISVVVGSDTIEAVIDSDTVSRIQIEAVGPVTDDSLGVATPAATLRDLPGARVATGEGNVAVILAGECGISFLLDRIPGRRPVADGPARSSLADVPASVAVRQVLIYGCP